ncbi:MAG: methylenetetrahydrofolate reductase [NAD(P)H] [Bacteroidales bacterium]|nr:methylenetetrahydrofolate reductase [NAD(P)H] [Bacteroidales bacterium]MBN2821119.1 methylenetetrahydrofolate reductase [NAD(P)H] [Bacteroidales bacterium]
MKISELFLSQERTFSFEFFPPKDEISAVDFGINVGQLMRLSPSFVTVTYGAGGSTQERTFNLVDYLQNKIGLTTMAHYTCVNASKPRIQDDLKFLQSRNIKNIMLLRGDPPKGEEKFVAPQNGFSYANELISYVDDNFDFCKAGACYVEKHPEAKSLEADLINLKRKVDAGADFLISQLFFDNNYYFSFMEKSKAKGINCRIIPGIIPITSYNQIERFTKMSGTKIPPELSIRLEEHKDNKAKTYQIGLDYTIKQCQELLAAGAPGIHFYTLNKSRAAIEIFESL